jgi:hypothetical protein
MTVEKHPELWKALEIHLSKMLSDTHEAASQISVQALTMIAKTS